MEKSDLKISVLPNGIKFGVKVIPNSSKCEITDVINGDLKIKLDVPPIEGKANEKCIKHLSKLLGVPKSSIEISSGQKSKNKVIYIKDDAEKLHKKLNDVLKNL